MLPNALNKLISKQIMFWKTNYALTFILDQPDFEVETLLLYLILGLSDVTKRKV